MGCAGRFRDAEGATYPEITHYNFPVDNLAVRGVENRSFRWGEVCAPGIWLFSEETQNGDFETSTYTGYSGLTTGTSTDSSTLAGWTVSGDQTYLLDTTVHTFSSGDLPGLTGTIHAVSISEELSVGLYSTDGGVVSVQQNLGALEPSENYMVYGEVHPSYGTSPNCRLFVEGVLAGSSVFFNPLTLAWQTARPTGSMFELTAGQFEALRFDVPTSSYPGSDPTGFQLIFEHDTSGQFLVVDELHVDQYEQRNAFVDNALPTGYMLEVTPAGTMCARCSRVAPTRTYRCWVR